MEHENSYSLIVIDETSDSAEAIAHALRDNGHLHTVRWVNSVPKLYKLIEANQHMVVLASTHLTWLSLDQVCQTCAEHGIPTIALSDSNDSQLLLRAIRQGAMTLSNPNDHSLINEHIHQAIALNALQQSLRMQQQQLSALDARCASLLDTANEPVAYTSEGVITAVNPAFARLLGVGDTLSLVGRLISDFIGAESLYEFSRQLRSLMRNDQTHTRMDNTVITTMSNATTQANVLMANVKVNDEHCTQIVLRDCLTTTASVRDKTQDKEISHVQHVLYNPSKKAFIQEKALSTAHAATLKLVPTMAEEQPNFESHTALEAQTLNAMMGKVNAWSTSPKPADTITSANDPATLASLTTAIQQGEMTLCSQPLLNLHADESICLARLIHNDTLIPVTRILEDTGDLHTMGWLLEQLKQLATNSPLVLGPIGLQIVSVDGIEQLQKLNISSQLIIALSEQALNHDYHGCCQFLLQLQRLKLKAALWMQSPPRVMADSIEALADSVRSGINVLVLNTQHRPIMRDKQIESADWEVLLQTCQRYNIQTITPTPEDTEQLQAWWQLGASWCLTAESTAGHSLKPTEAGSANH